MMFFLEFLPTNFKEIKRYNPGFEAKIQEALLVKKFNSTLNRQLYLSV